MKNLLYLLNFTVSGIKNIKEDIRLDFYKKTIDKFFNPEEYRIKAIYGENGAGKSAIITSIKIFRDLLINDNYLSESKNQNFLEEIINKEMKTFKISCEYIVNGENSKTVFNYSVCLGKNASNLYEIKYERLMKKNGNYPNHKYQTLFECRSGELISVEVSEPYKEYLKRKSLNLLASHPMMYLYLLNMSSGENKMHNDAANVSLTIDLVACLLFVLSITIYLGEEDQHELYFLRKRMKEIEIDNKALGKYFLEVDRNIDILSSVNEKKIEKQYFDKYEEKIERLTSFIKIFKSELVSIDIDKKEDGEYYICELLLNYGKYRINKEFESTGIKKLIRLFDCFMAASGTGITFIDEMDSNLNDVYLCKLVEYFMYYGKGQLCFTTHNLDPMIVLKDNKNSIDFLSSDNHVIPWKTRGNSSPDNCYRNGMIEKLPFNVDATDFLGILGE